MMKKNAVVLLSGGLDSATTLFMAKKRGYRCHCLIFDYGQRHKREIEMAKKISRLAGCKYKFSRITLPWKGSALLDKKIALPKQRSLKVIPKEVPSSYVPARNTIFLSFALSFAEAIGAQKIFIGANAVDFSGYPDCRGPYFKAFEKVAKIGTKAGIKGRRISIETPLLSMTKSQIVKKGLKLKVPHKYTWSCYEGKKRPCGICDSCIIREKGFKDARAEDPLKIDG